MASEMQERIALALFDEAERQLKAAYPNRDPAQWGMAKEFDRVSHLAVRPRRHRGDAGAEAIAWSSLH